jgi:hypothetical protein
MLPRVTGGFVMAGHAGDPSLGEGKFIGHLNVLWPDAHDVQVVERTGVAGTAEGNVVALVE